MKKGQEVEFYQKKDHPNKNSLDPRMVAKNLNEDDDHKRTF